MSIVGVKLSDAQAQILGHVFQAFLDALGPGLADVVWNTAWIEFIESRDAPERMVAELQGLIDEHLEAHPERRPTAEELEQGVLRLKLPYGYDSKVPHFVR